MLVEKQWLTSAGLLQDRTFSQQPGVLSTRVGYTGGTSPEPTYQSVCSDDGHTESVQIHFDPQATSYEDLLRVSNMLSSINPSVWMSDVQQALLQNNKANCALCHQRYLTSSYLLCFCPLVTGLTGGILRPGFLVNKKYNLVFWPNDLTLPLRLPMLSQTCGV